MRRSQFVTWIFLIHIALIALFFDPKIHIGGDDADYIVAAMDFMDGVSFPSWHGSFYPIFLSAFIGLFGVNLVIFKLISVILTVLSTFVLYKTLHSRIPDSVVHFAIAIFCFSHAIVFYSSTTYSEPLFIFFQSIIMYLLVHADEMPAEVIKLRYYVHWLLLGLFVFLLSITRNVGFGAGIAIIVYYLTEKRFKNVIIFAATLLFFHGLFFAYKYTVWEINALGVEGQFNRIAYKNFYNPLDGSEDWKGFIFRFWENSRLYLSKHLVSLIGLKSSASQSTSGFITLIFYFLFAGITILARRRSKLVIFILLYVGTLLGVTFITQQTHWDQVRLVLVYLPLIAVALGFAIVQASQVPSKIISHPAKALLFILPLVVLLRTISTPNHFFNTIDNMTSDPFAGYQEEWKNYALISQWAGSRLPTEENILCRKPGIASIYGKRKFCGISRFHDTVPDSADQFLARKNIHYVVHDNVGMPTVTRLLAYYLQKHPLGLKFVHSEGRNKSSSLLQVNRTPPSSDVDYLNRVQAGLLIYPNHSYYYILAADKYASMGKFENSVKFYSAALGYATTDRERGAAHWNRANSYFKLKELGNAKKDVNAVLAFDPSNADALRALYQINALEKMY